MEYWRKKILKRRKPGSTYRKEGGEDRKLMEVMGNKD